MSYMDDFIMDGFDCCPCCDDQEDCCPDPQECFEDDCESCDDHDCHSAIY